MRYFKIRHTDDYTIKGEVDAQVIDFVDKPKNYSSHADSLYRLYENINDFPNIEINFIDLKLQRKANLTDVLSSSILVNGFLVNDRLLPILQSHNLQPYKIYQPINVVGKKGNRIVYSYLHILFKYPHLSWEDSKYAYIDFDKTRFTSGTILGKDKEYLGLLSKEILMGLPRENKQGKSLYYTAETLHLTKEFTELQLDLVKFYYLGIDWFCSERLKNAIEDAGITGFDILETDKIITEE